MWLNCGWTSIRLLKDIILLQAIKNTLTKCTLSLQRDLIPWLDVAHKTNASRNLEINQIK